MASVNSLLDAPWVDAALPDLDGGAPNLLPLTALLDNLRVEVPMWPESLPLPGLPETLSLYWDGVRVDSRSWESSVPADELFAHVPREMLTEGRHTLHYHVRIFNGEESDSLPIAVTIDRTRPYLGANEGKLVFPAEVVAEGVTARYLELNGDVLKATVPSYVVPAVGDRIVWYWDQVPFSDDVVAERSLALSDIGQPLLLEFAGEVLRARGDGVRYAYYRVFDRAGNVSDRARPELIDTQATPIPRVLPWPNVPKATGTAQTIRLVLDTIAAPVLVTLPTGAVIYPGEAVSVEWGVPGTFGYHLATQTYQGQAGNYELPLAKVVAQAARTVQVRYRVEASEGLLFSQQRQVTVQKLASASLPRPYLQGAGVSGTQVSLSKVGTWTDVRLDPWFLMAAGQRVTLLVSGVSPGGGVVAETLLENHEVRSANERVDTRLAKSYLQRLQLSSSFTVTAKLSYDGGESWAHERSLNLTLVA